MVQLGGEIFDAQPASLVQQPFALGSGADVQAAGVVGIGRDLNQLAASQPGDNAAHGGRLDLLGGGEFAERLGAAEDEDRKGREAGRALAGGDVLFTNSAQQVDCSGVQAVCHG